MCKILFFKNWIFYLFAILYKMFEIKFKLIMWLWFLYHKCWWELGSCYSYLFSSVYSFLNVGFYFNKICMFIFEKVLIIVLWIMQELHDEIIMLFCRVFMLFLTVLKNSSIIPLQKSFSFHHPLTFVSICLLFFLLFVIWYFSLLL